MRRKGTVAAINPIRGMVGILTEDDAYTIIELTSDWELEIGDEVSWADGYGLGFCTFENLSKNTRDEVFVQNHAVGKSNLRAQLML